MGETKREPELCVFLHPLSSTILVARGKGEREKRKKNAEERATAGKKKEGEAHRGDKRHRRGILNVGSVRPPFNGDSRARGREGDPGFCPAGQRIRSL